MKKNNDDWLRALRDKVDVAQKPSEHDAEAFDALMARIAPSATPTAAGASRPGRTLRRVALLAAAAVLAGVALLVFRPSAVDDNLKDTLADNTTVVEPMMNDVLNADLDAAADVDVDGVAAVVDASGIDAVAGNLLAQATPSHTKASAASSSHTAASVNHHPVVDETPAPASSDADRQPSSSVQEKDAPAVSSSKEASSSKDASSSKVASHEEASAMQPMADRRQADVSRRDHGYANVDPSLMGKHGGVHDRTGDWHLMLAAAGGGENAAIFTPTFAIPYASSEASTDYAEFAPMMATPSRRGAAPELDGALTTYDYDVCTFVHHTPVRFKAMALCDVWSPGDNLALSVGSGVMYTELTSTVYPLFINTTYIQRLRFVGIPLEADLNWYVTRRWNVFAGAGLTGEYCFSAMLHNQRQPEHPFHVGAYEQVGVGMRLTSELRLGLAAECSQSFTRTVMNTVRNTRPNVFGVNISLSYSVR